MSPKEKKEEKKEIPKAVIKEEESEVGALLKKVVEEAIEKKSSDIHFEPREEDMVVRYRIDGLLRDVYTIDKKMSRSLIFKLKVASRLRTDEHFEPQDGRVEFVVGKNEVDTRVSIVPTSNGEKVVLRLLAKSGEAFTLEDLGMADTVLEKVKKAYSQPYGMIVAAGPTGSGKTTTLYSILSIINSREKNITTIEDPVEYTIDGVNHMQVNPKANLTFASGLRSVLRQDPDIIMIGEIRDKEAARIAINSAMTGHLVLTTMHTNDSITTVPRFIDMGIEDYLVASTVNLVIAQRLARRLCDKCKQKTTLSPERYAEIMKYRADIGSLLKSGETTYTSAGCPACENTGFKGRVGLFEVLEISRPIRDLITASATSDQLLETATKEGLVLLVEDGLKKTRTGVTSVEEVMRVTALKE